MKLLSILAFSFLSIPAFADLTLSSVKGIGVRITGNHTQVLQVSVFGEMRNANVGGFLPATEALEFDFSSNPEYAPKVYDACMKMLTDLREETNNAYVQIEFSGSEGSRLVRGCSYGIQ